MSSSELAYSPAWLSQLHLLVTTFTGNVMAIQNALASLAVSDIAAAISWYSRLFDRAADTQPMPNLAEWKFPNGGWLQIYQGIERAGKGSVTLSVDNLEQHISALQKLGVDTHDYATNVHVKTLMIKDPDGNSIALAQAINSQMAR
ncbi:MAG TPA: VOC family protein [Cellvibrionaceae bacterium]